MNADTVSFLRTRLAKIREAGNQLKAPRKARAFERRIDTGLPPVVLGKPEGWNPSPQLLRECPQLLGKDVPLPAIDLPMANAGPKVRDSRRALRGVKLGPRATPPKNSVLTNPIYADLKECLERGESLASFGRRKGIVKTTVAAAAKKLGVKSTHKNDRDAVQRISEFIAGSGCVDVDVMARALDVSRRTIWWHLRNMTLR